MKYYIDLTNSFQDSWFREGREHTLKAICVFYIAITDILSHALISRTLFPLPTESPQEDLPWTPNLSISRGNHLPAKNKIFISVYLCFPEILAFPSVQPPSIRSQCCQLLLLLPSLNHCLLSTINIILFRSWGSPLKTTAALTIINNNGFHISQLPTEQVLNVWLLKSKVILIWGKGFVNYLDLAIP